MVTIKDIAEECNVSITTVSNVLNGKAKVGEQTKQRILEVYIIISKNEGCVKANIERKEAESERMKAEMTKYTKEITKKELTSSAKGGK